MKRARFSEEQIIGILRENEAGAKAGELARKHGVSEGTIYAWKAKFGGMSVSDAQRLRTLEEENGKLKRLLAEAMLDKAALNELLANGRARRDAPRRRPSPDNVRDQRAAGLLNHQGGPQDGALPVTPSAGYRAARAPAQPGRRAAAVRLSAIVRAAAAGGRARARTASTGYTARRA